MFLIDGDLRLRAVEPADAEVLYTLINDPAIESMVVGWSEPVSLTSQREWIESLHPDDFRFVVKEAGVARGVATINPIDFKNGSANVNIKLLNDATGVASEGVLLEYLFREVAMDVVTAGVLDTNLPSQRLFEALGFVRDGLLRSRIYKSGPRHGVIQYSMLRAEYLQK